MQKGEIEKINYQDVFIQYSIESGLMDVEADRYRQQIKGVIYYTTPMIEPEHVVEIGKITAEKLLLGNAADNGYPGIEVFDTDAFVMEIGQAIYDFERNDFSEDCYERFDISFMDLLILGRLEILPAYRGNNIGKYAIKDLYNNFIGGCGLMTLKCFPLQLEGSQNDPPRPGEPTQMQPDLPEPDEEIATYKLLAYYTSMGFRYFPELSESLLFITPAFKNATFNEIKLA